MSTGAWPTRDRLRESGTEPPESRLGAPERSVPLRTDHPLPSDLPGRAEPPARVAPPGQPAPPGASAPPGQLAPSGASAPPGGSAPPGLAAPSGASAPSGQPAPPGHSGPPGQAVGTGPEALSTLPVDNRPETSPPHEPVQPGTAAKSPPAGPPSTDGGTRLRARLGHRVSAAARSVVASRRSRAGSALGPLLSVHQARYPRADMQPLRKAYLVAEAHHRGQLRKSGEPFITHPLAVATILAELGMDTTTLVAALLHDTVEDTGYTLIQSQATFGLEVAHLVDGVTKLDKVRFGQAAEAETIRKMIVAGGRDLRVLVIKLADRLHNMRTLRYQPPHKQQSIARATLDVLVPLADRLGIHVLKRELEALCFGVLQPTEHSRTSRLEAARAAERSLLLSDVVPRLEASLRENRLVATVRDRPRHSFSAYRTTVERGGTAEQDLLDPPRLLIVVAGEPGDCYAAFGAVHGLWRPVPGRFKDYIALPKFNMYQSLHTTVLGPGDESIDVLIRTEAMHRVAEYGLAAHVHENAASGEWRPTSGAGRPQDLEWLRRLLDWQREVADAGEFFRTLRSDLGGDREVMVFAAGEGPVTLPEGATPVDLAYAMGGSIGHRTWFR